jgi:hypothetical protein
MMKNNWAFLTNSCICRGVILTLPLQPRGTDLRIKAMLKRRSFSACARTAAIVALTAGVAIFSYGGVAAHAETVSVICTNPVSGASWRIAIDYDLKTVDSNPASIDETQIWWRDGKDGWRYTLDRKSGALTVVLASATGGNFLFDQCRMP